MIAMQNRLEELYVGNVGFDAGDYGKNSPFAKAARRKLNSNHTDSGERSVREE